MFDTGMMMLRGGKVTDEEMVKALNTSTRPDGVSIQRGRYEFSRYKDATAAELQKDNIKVISNTNAQFSVVVAKQIYNTPTRKTLEEARGYVVAEYQDYLEKQWNEKMRREYPVKVNDAVFKTMVGKK